MALEREVGRLAAELPDLRGRDWNLRVTFWDQQVSCYGRIRRDRILILELIMSAWIRENTQISAWNPMREPASFVVWLLTKYSRFRETTIVEAMAIQEEIPKIAGLHALTILSSPFRVYRILTSHFRASRPSHHLTFPITSPTHLDRLVERRRRERVVVLRVNCDLN